MDVFRKKPSLRQNESHCTQESFIDELNESSYKFPLSSNTLPEKECNKKQINETSKDCIYEPDNININTTTSNLNDKDKKIFEKQSSSLLDTETNVDNLMESVDLSDLTFSCNDFILGDCNCFEQASQLVDPTLKDSESTPFSFNNSDSVQLFRFSLTESTEENLTCLNSFINKDNSDKSDKENDTLKNDHYNFYKVFELFDSNMNVNKDVKNQKDECVQYKKDNNSDSSNNKINNKDRSSKNTEKTLKVKKNEKSVMTTPIKKGRRYLPNFKQKVLEYAKSHTFKETALHFKINCNTITEWSRESKRLSLKNNGSTMPGSDYKNYKTDIVGTPESKTEIIYLNDVISIETDTNEPSLKQIEEDLPSIDMKPDERFIKWVETKRLQRKQLSRFEVYHIAKCCLKKCPGNQEKSSWFVSWFKRFNKALKNSVKCNIEKEKYVKYPNSFKLEVALYARAFSKNSAARVFNVPRRRMFDWFNCLNSVKEYFPLLGKNVTGDISEDTIEKDEVIFETKKDRTKNKIYSELYVWYQKRFLNGARPTSYEIKEKGKEIFSSYGLTGIKFSDGWLQKFCQRMNIKLRHSEDDRLLLWVLTQFDNNVTLSHQQITEKSSLLIGKKKFKGSKGWTLRFLKRHRNLLQNFPTVRDQLPQIVQEKLTNFWEDFRHSLVSTQMEPGNIGCMDEIPLNFNYPEEGKSASLPLLRKTGFENCQGVVILCALGNGRVLPPAVVFKGRSEKQLFSEKNLDVLILYQEKGLITINILETWFHDIWLSCTQTPNLLVVDSFQPHCTIQMRQLFMRENCSLHVIPEGCSSRFQALNVEATSLFKETIKKQWKEFSTDLNLNSLNITRKYRCPNQDTILRWVQNAYEKIQRNPVSIINSFKETGLIQ